MGIVGTETYYVPDELEIPKFSKEADLWDFIHKNNLESAIDYEFLSNTGLVDIEGDEGESILKNYQ